MVVGSESFGFGLLRGRPARSLHALAGYTVWMDEVLLLLCSKQACSHQGSRHLQMLAHSALGLVDV